MHLVKFLSKAKAIARRRAELLIFAKKVSINRILVTHPSVEIDPEKDIVSICGNVVTLPKHFLYYLLNKPRGYICSNRRMRNEKLAIDLITHSRERLFTVGRLDKDTSGLIILTNDGDFAQQISHPRHGVHKEYLVKTAQEISAQDLVLLSAGTIIEGVLLRPLRVKKMRRGTLKIVLEEGKNREVRKIISSAHLTLLELIRIRIGSIHLGKMPFGHYRPLTSQERMELV